MDKFQYFETVLARVFTYGQLLVLDKGLLDQNLLGVEISHATFNDLVDDFVRFAFLPSGFEQDFALF
jgi:hypothetical protein